MKYGSRRRVDQKSDILPHWMAAHACLKNEYMEDKKSHNARVKECTRHIWVNIKALPAGGRMILLFESHKMPGFVHD